MRMMTRSPRSVLRLYNIFYRHGQAIQQHLTPPKAMTLRKLCGIYYHSAVDHAPLLYRLICLRSIGAELFERYFDRIEDITRKTWNKHIEDLVPNAFLSTFRSKMKWHLKTTAFQIKRKKFLILLKVFLKHTILLCQRKL